MPEPTFIIVGGQKCGTTAVTGMLRLHPMCYMPGNELHYWDRNRGGGFKKYCRAFSDKYTVRGEKTPKYLAEPSALVRIAQHMPDIKLVLLFRDPVKRYVSNCRHWNRLIKSTKYLGLQRFDATQEGGFARWRGMYADQLRLVYSLFPKRNVHFEFSEDLRHHTSDTMTRIQRFIGLEPRAMSNDPDPDHVLPKTHPVLDKLKKLYRPFNDRLAALTDCDAPFYWEGMQ